MARNAGGSTLLRTRLDSLGALLAGDGERAVRLREQLVLVVTLALPGAVAWRRSLPQSRNASKHANRMAVA